MIISGNDIINNRIGNNEKLFVFIGGFLFIVIIIYILNIIVDNKLEIINILLYLGFL